MFLAGHRVMVQVQSSWFPLVDRNPQSFVDIYRAGEADFRKETERIHHAEGAASRIILNVIR
jgi:predicted acyl esterase